jgi:hypothetical protein
MGLQETACKMARDIYQANIVLLDSLIILNQPNATMMLETLIEMSNLNEYDRFRLLEGMHIYKPPSMVSALSQFNDLNCQYLEELMGLKDIQKLATSVDALTAQIANLPYVARKLLYDNAVALMLAGLKDGAMIFDALILSVITVYMDWLNENGVIDMIMDMVDAEACLLSLCGDNEESYTIERRGEEMLRSQYYAKSFYIDLTNRQLNMDQALTELEEDIAEFTKPTEDFINAMYGVYELVIDRSNMLYDRFLNPVTGKGIEGLIPDSIYNFYKKWKGGSSISSYTQMNVPGRLNNTAAQAKALINTSDLDIVKRIKLKFSFSFNYKMKSAFGQTIAIPTLINNSVTEPTPTSTRSSYGQVKVTETKGGHLFRMDDTPGNKTLSLTHPSNSYISMNDDNSLNLKAVGNMLVVTNKDFQISIDGDKVEIVDGNQRINIKSDSTINIEKDSSHTVCGNSANVVKKNWVVTAEGNIELGAVGNVTINAQGTVNINSIGKTNVVSTQGVALEAPEVVINAATKIEMTAPLIQLTGAVIREN